MNERIQKLLIQSEVFNKDGTVLKDVTGYELNKFAELIVRECSQYIEDKFDFCGDELIIAEKLLEHFGVE